MSEKTTSTPEIPPSLKNFTTRILNIAKTPEQTKEIKDFLIKTIRTAKQSGTLTTTDWDNYKIPKYAANSFFFFSTKSNSSFCQFFFSTTKCSTNINKSLFCSQ